MDIEKFNAESERLTPRAVGNADSEPCVVCGDPYQIHGSENHDHCWKAGQTPHAVGNAESTCRHGQDIHRCKACAEIGMLKAQIEVMRSELTRLTPHATGNAEPQEWTVDERDTGNSLMRGDEEIAWFRSSDIDDAISIRDAHNAAIERAKAEAHQDGWHEGRQYQVDYGVTAQSASSESWQEIAEKVVIRLMDYSSMDFNDEERKEHEDKVSVILAAIERSHAAQPQRSEQVELGNHDCEYDSDGAPCNRCGKTAAEAIMYSERKLRSDQPQSATSQLLSGNVPRTWHVKNRLGDWNAIYDEGGNIVGHAYWRDDRDKITSAHNQALAAERQLREQAEEDVEEMNGYVKQAKASLLSAQAAIKWALSQYANLDVGVCAILKKLRDVDLSALQKHDEEILADREAHFVKRLAEVREPLVDALEEIAQCKYHAAETVRLIARNRLDALAKVKEGEG